MFRVKTHNSIAEKGLEQLQEVSIEVASELDTADALLIRSYLVSLDDLQPSLQAIARAGAGTNNVPVQECTERGVVVFNTPGANANSVKELVLAALLLSSRDILGGVNYVRSLGPSASIEEVNKLVEAQKKQFKGQELIGKTLGVVGLGSIGALVARAGLDLGMQVVGYDPAISVEAAWSIPSKVKRMQDVTSLFETADFISLHVPLVPETKSMINTETLKKFKKGSALLNFSREPIVDSYAVAGALDRGALSLFVSDFPVPGLLQHERAIFTPHLGASTIEAEENCAMMAAVQLRDFLLYGSIVNSVNFPSVTSSTSEGFRMTVSNHNVPGALGRITAILAERNINVLDLTNKSRGDLAYNLIDVSEPIKEELVKAISDVESVIRVRVLPPYN